MKETPALVPTVASGPAASGASKTSQTPEQLRTLAAQFESLLLTQLLNTMRSSMFGDEQDEGTGFAKGPLADAVYSELSLALSRSGGFGLSESVMGPLLRENGLTEPTGPHVESAPPVSSVLSGRVTSSYGWRRDPLDGSLRLHKGTDIAMPVGQDVPAARAGRVGFAGELPGYGLTVVVNHDGGRATRYAHLSELTVGAGDAVVEGQVIARSGATGRATGPHLHFELLEDGKPVDPAGRLGLLGAAIQISD